MVSTTPLHLGELVLQCWQKHKTMEAFLVTKLNKQGSAEQEGAIFT